VPRKVRREGRATGAAGDTAARLEPFVTMDGIYAYATAPALVLVAPLFQQAFICGVGAGVAESGAGLIEGFPYTGPFEHLELKERQPP
jgi:hypothetical protein